MSQSLSIDQFKLFPCPFCGGTELSFIEAPFEKAELGYGVEVSCECGACGGGAATEETAVRRWNCRAPLDAQTGRSMMRNRTFREFTSEELQQLDPDKIVESYLAAGFVNIPQEEIPTWLLDDELSNCRFLTQPGAQHHIPIHLNKAHEDWEGRMTSLIWRLADIYMLSEDEVYRRFLKRSGKSSSSAGVF